MIGFFLSSLRHPYLDRKNRRILPKANRIISNYLLSGHIVTLFPEGTSTGNDCVLPFYSELLRGASLSKSPIFPIGIRWLSNNDSDVNISEDLCFWKKGDAFLPHLIKTFSIKSMEINIFIGSPLLFQDYSKLSKRELAENLTQKVSSLSKLPIIFDNR